MRGRAALVAVASLAVAVALVSVPPAGAANASPRFGEVLRGSSARPAAPVVPPGFQDTVAISGLTYPSVVQFAPDGRVFVGQKGGVVLEYDSITDPTATVVADLSTNVYDYGDRGLLGLALDPNFLTNPYLYVLYTLDAPIGQQPPVYNDTCGGSYCVAGARTSRILVDANNHGGPEQVLIEGWCQQYDSHSIGTLAFGPEGALYVGGGDGASYNDVDYGQFGNPCADPANEGGALRSQDIVHRGDPTGLNGAILRVDPATGAAWPGNPLIGNSDPNDDRIIAEGLRNPYRFALKPGGSDTVFVGDVGWNAWEEIDTIRSAGDAKVEDFGWPCYEGTGRQSGYEGANLAICQNLYGNPSRVTTPFFTMSHGQSGCNGSNVYSAVGFSTGSDYPTEYAGAFFFGDVVRGCLWTMFAKPNGNPDPSTRFVFASGLYAVDVKTGPNGDLFYVDIYGGSIHEISYTG
jgi:glucose/arabinose dehydrogenase